MWRVRQRERGLSESVLWWNSLKKKKKSADLDRLLDKFIIGETQQETAPHTQLQQTHPAHTQTEAVKHTAGCLHITAETSGETKTGGGGEREKSAERLRSALYA